VARNRQRNRSSRPAPDPGLDPLFPQRSGPPEPPIQDDAPIAFADGDDDGGAASAAFGAEEAAHERESRGSFLSRTVGFLRNSWAELQRVQWPDRQQVAQATGVVLGFVVVTGIFLGVADYLAGKLINFII
jgi:preprotein translocase SecE subunit